MGKAGFMTVATALCLVLGGCSAAGGQAPLSSEQIKALAADEAADGHAEQAAVLKDGQVTADEYEAQFELLRTCIVDAGYLVSEPILSPVTNTNIEFVYNSNGRNQEGAFTDYDACEDTYWVPTSTAYMDTAPQKMDEALRQATIQCMERQGIKVDDSPETLRELSGEDSTRQNAASECVTQEAHRLFPQLQSLLLPPGPPS